MTFKALLATKTGEKISTSMVEMHEQDLMPGDVTVKVDYSTVNYKDALALTGYADIIQQFQLIPGIDFAGTVEASSYSGIEVGDRVVANSWGLSQSHHGGFAQNWKAVTPGGHGSAAFAGARSASAAGRPQDHGQDCTAALGRGLIAAL